MRQDVAAPQSAQHWRNEAEAARAAASLMLSEGTKARLFELAKNYDVLAKRAQEQRKAKGSGARSDHGRRVIRQAGRLR